MISTERQTGPQSSRFYQLPYSFACESAVPDCIQGIREAFLVRQLLEHRLNAGDSALRALNVDPYICALSPSVRGDAREVGATPFFQVLDLKVGPGQFKFDGGSFNLRGEEFAVHVRSGFGYEVIGLDEDIWVGHYRAGASGVTEVARTILRQNQW